MKTPLVKLVGVKKHFPITQGIIFQKRIGAVQAVDGVDLEVYPGETVGVVGETGCGKSTTARLITKLLDATEGQVLFDGQDITHLKRKAMRPIRRDIQMIFQDPYASLNPRKTVGFIIGEPLRIHGTVPKNHIKGTVRELMDRVGLNPEHYNRYPHEFSGGQRQRIGVARALALHPRLIVADEPVSALDVSVQAQVLNLLEDLQHEFNLTYVFIAHDLSVVRHVSDRIAVMYLGKIVELSPAKELYVKPIHPYTDALLAAIPRVGATRRTRIRSGGTSRTAWLRASTLSVAWRRNSSRVRSANWRCRPMARSGQSSWRTIPASTMARYSCRMASAMAAR